jgi:hypothetical protein
MKIEKSDFIQIVATVVSALGVFLSLPSSASNSTAFFCLCLSISALIGNFHWMIVESRDKVISKISPKDGLKVFENSDLASEYLVSRLETATRVYNTHLVVNGIRHQYTPKATTLLVEGVASVLRKQGQWQDIFLGHAGKFYDEILKSVIRLPASHLYSAAILGASGVICQDFIVLEDNRSGKREVLFGWGNRPGADKVFLSESNDLVAYYKSMFDFMWNDATVKDLSADKVLQQLIWV